MQYVHYGVHYVLAFLRSLAGKGCREKEQCIQYVTLYMVSQVECRVCGIINKPHSLTYEGNYGQTGQPLNAAWWSFEQPHWPTK
jgi:hypothetical protein